MLRLKRNAEEFDVIALFSEMASHHNYKIDSEEARNDFLARVKESINHSTNCDTKIYGHRTENLFCYVAGALGKALLIKQEDAGSAYTKEHDIQPADYRITLDNKKQILVEVKNCHAKKMGFKFKIKQSYLSKLQKYAELNSIELKLAIYFSSFGIWSLLSISSLVNEGDFLSIDLPAALAKSEMASLGDCKIGTEPNLEIHLLTGEGEEQEINAAGEAPFIAREIKIYSNHRELTKESERNIAFHLMRFGDWVEVENDCIVVENKLKGIRLAYGPTDQTEPNFSLIGDLSTMITKGFNEYTTNNGEVTSLKPTVEPGTFSIAIPNDYNSKDLPLWRFIIQPNKTFGSKNNTNA